MAEPVAVLAGGDSGAVGEFLLFDGSGSYDPDGTIFRWRCSFGDGGKAQGKGHPGTFGHAYQAEGSYKLQFVVTDNRKQRSATLTRIITIGEATEEPDPDTVPDSFAFVSQTGVPVSTVTVSNTVTISGLTAQTTISVLRGEYSKNGGAYTSTAGTIGNGDTVAVRLTSAATNLTESNCELNVGGVTAIFSVTTEAAAPLDTTPNPFGFQGVTGATTGAVVESESITVGGINTTVPISISGASGEYSKNGAAFTTSAGTVVAGDAVRVRLTASGSADTAVSTTLTIGTGTGIFTVRTAPAPADDGTPDAFNWPTLTGQVANTVITSSSITITGINIGVDVSVSGGGSPEYSINGGAFTSSPGTGTVDNGDTIRVRLTSSSTEGATLTAAVTIGGVIGRFSVTTAVITVSSPTFYVDKTNGSNSNNGGSGAPWQTLPFALSQLRPADTLIVKAGSDGLYDVNLTWLPSGLDLGDRKIKIVNFTGHTITLKPTTGTHIMRIAQGPVAYVEFDGINFNGTSMSSYSGCAHLVGGAGSDDVHHIRIRNATITGKNGGRHYGAIVAGPKDTGTQSANGHGFEFIDLVVTGGGIDDFDHGIYMAGNFGLIDGCTISDIPGCGVHVYSSKGNPLQCVVRNTIIRDGRSTSVNQRHCGFLDAGAQTRGYNNLIHDIPAQGASAGLSLYTSIDSQHVFTTIYNTEIGINVDGSAARAILRNVIAYGSTTNYRNGSATTTQDHNLFSVNPLFVNPSSDNFALQASSPARNAGIPVSWVTDDITGLSRPQGSAPDIGAYEYDE